MEPAKTQASKLFIYSPIDFRDKVEERYERAFQSLQNSLHGSNAKELNVVITSMVSLEIKQQEDLQLSIIYLMLVDTQMASLALRDLLIVTRDGLEFIVVHLTELINSKFQKLAEIAKHQVLWLFKELLKSYGSNQKINGLLWALLRQACGGDTSSKNIAWIEGVLDILIEHRSRFDKFPNSVGLVAYSYVRLIEDHNAVSLIPLRNKEVKFIISLIRDRFQDIIPLGRDFIRLLQNVARIPEFQQLWKDILTNPKSLAPAFTGIFQMLSTRTSRHFIGNRITPEIENKLHFFTSSVKFGNHKKYQDWFQDRYFATPESQSLRSDVIRYIINAIHPTNELLCSDIIPRWAILGWLLTSCTNPVALTNAKLAVFYDWLCFDPARDNIMNVEPGILVMYHSIKNVPMVSSTLLDFLCRIMKNFYPKGEERIRAGVHNSLKVILEKQVIPNLSHLFESQKLDRDLRVMIRDNFREFMPSSTTPPTGATPAAAAAAFMMENQNHFPAEGDGRASKVNNNNSIEIKSEDAFEKSDEPKFSDDDECGGDEKKLKMNEAPSDDEEDRDGDGGEDIKDADDDNDDDDEDEDDDDLPLSKVRLKEKPLPDKIELPTAIRESFSKFLNTKATGEFESFLEDFRSLPASAQLDSEQEAYVYANILSIFKSTLPEKCDLDEFENVHKLDECENSEKLEQKLEQSISYPLFAIYKTIYNHDEKAAKKCLVIPKLIEYCHSKLASMGFLLLLYLKVSARLSLLKNQKVPMTFRSNVYKLYYQWTNQKSSQKIDVDACLERDLQLMEQYSLKIFLWLISDVYREFEQNAVNNSDILKVVVGCVDAKNLHDLICDITQGKLVMFKNDGVIDVIRESLEYETFEQMCFWQLLLAHDVPISHIQDIIPELEASSNEALINMLFILKKEEPTDELIKLLLSRETSKGDSIVTSVLIHWCMDYDSQLSESIANLLISKISQNSPKKRARSLKSNSQSTTGPSADQLLNHLENLRKCCSYGNNSNVTGMYLHEKMQRALQQAFNHCDERQKKQYSELFSLAVEDDTTISSRRGASSRGRKPQAKKETNSNSTSNKKTVEANNSKYSSEDESDEDRSKAQKAHPAKRRKKVTQLSDSE